MSAKRPDCICSYCGKAYHPKEASRTKYCSRGCYFAHKTKKKEDKIKVDATRLNRICVICGLSFHSKRPSICCSDECRRKKAREDNVVYHKERKTLKERKCKECGNVFVPEYGNKKRVFCSDSCSNKHHDPLIRRAQKHRRQARLKGNEHESFRVVDIYERDGWKCGICGKKVDKKLKPPHHKSASLDHIVPVSCGGAHKKSNVQLAHWICNVRIREHGVKQLRLFG